MPKGGARTKSGPPQDPKSRTSERKGFTETTLPVTGFDGEVPDLLEYLPDASSRHMSIWDRLWRTPQACMWDRQPWLIPIVADLVRCQVRSEDPEAPAAWETPVQQKRTELGLTPSGMRFLGWAVAENQLAAKQAEKQEAGSTEGDEVAQRRQKRLR